VASRKERARRKSSRKAARPSPEDRPPLGRTLTGVTRLTHGRGGGSDPFDVVLSGDGLEIRHPDEDVRHLPWSEISEWEIERRRGGVRLFLRGGGAVTSLVVPGWSVEDLDGVLGQVTAPVPEPAR
jgi:hypothetical protein